MAMTDSEMCDCGRHQANVYLHILFTHRRLQPSDQIWRRSTTSTHHRQRGSVVRTSVFDCQTFSDLRSPLLPTCYTSFLEPASYITQNSSSELFIPLSATFIWTCRFNLLHTAITFHHFFTVSLWAQNLPVQKILSSTLTCFRLSDWSHGSRPFTGLTCSSVFMF